MADTPEMGRTPSTDELVPELTFDEIDRAFDNNEFCFYLQPKCNAATGAIVGAEALVRWNHPKYGVVSPGRFVPMLEQAGQISRLDVFVWRSVVRMLARWEREGRNLVPISVNVSMVDIDQMDVADTLTGLLNEYDVDARLLQAEITESAVARNLSKVESTIRKLHADNIAVLMDDFGSAYSSLNMLKDINVDVIKLDMKFIDLNEDNASKGLKIVESVVNMARKLRLLVYAVDDDAHQQRHQQGQRHFGHVVLAEGVQHRFLDHVVYAHGFAFSFAIVRLLRFLRLPMFSAARFRPSVFGLPRYVRPVRSSHTLGTFQPSCQ